MRIFICLLSVSLVSSLSADITIRIQQPIEKVFPEVKMLKVKKGSRFRQYSVPSTISVDELALRLKKALGPSVQFADPSDFSDFPYGRIGNDFKPTRVIVEDAKVIGFLSRDLKNDSVYILTFAEILPEIDTDMELPGQSDNSTSKKP